MSAQASSVAGFVDEVATDQAHVTHPEGRVDVQYAPLAIPSITRYDGSARAATQTQQRQLPQNVLDATTADPYVTAATAGTDTSSTARHILTSTLDLHLAAETPLHVAADEIAADASNVLELSPPPPVSRSQEPATSFTRISAPPLAMAPAIIPWASSSSGSAIRPGRFFDPPQLRGHTASTTSTAAAPGLSPSSTLRPTVRHPPGLPVTPSGTSQHPMELQQQAWLQQQHQQYHEEPYPPRPQTPEPLSPPAAPAGAVMPQWPTEPFEHQQLFLPPTHPANHHTPHFNHPTTLADRDAARIITALERYRYEIHRLSNCLTCVSAPRSVVLLPCKHLALCEACAVSMEEAIQGRVQGCCQEGTWVDFSAEGSPSAQAAVDMRWNVCPMCGAGVEGCIAGVRL